MFEYIDNLEIISSFHQNSKNYNKIVNRPSHSFILRETGRVVYNFSDKKIFVNPCEMIFIPKGSTYLSQTISEFPSLYTSINFQSEITNVQPKAYSLKDFYDTDYIMKHFSDHFNLGSTAEKYKALSVFYSLLSYVCALENSSYPEQKKFEIIEPAVSHLKKHIFDASLKVDELHKMCNISNTYFRQIFISRFNMTPQHYILTNRLSHAKSAIETGDFNSIGEIAISFGFSDPLYFSRLFKKVYGISPSSFGKYSFKIKTEL